MSCRSPNAAKPRSHCQPDLKRASQTSSNALFSRTTTSGIANMAAQMKEFLGTSYLFGGNAPFIEELYEKYLENPEAVEPQWRRWFDQIQQPGAPDVAHQPIREAFVRLAYQRPGGNGHAPT